MINALVKVHIFMVACLYFAGNFLPNEVWSVVCGFLEYKDRHSLMQINTQLYYFILYHRRYGMERISCCLNAAIKKCVSYRKTRFRDAYSAMSFWGRPHPYIRHPGFRFLDQLENNMLYFSRQSINLRRCARAHICFTSLMTLCRLIRCVQTIKIYYPETYDEICFVRGSMNYMLARLAADNV